MAGWVLWRSSCQSVTGKGDDGSGGRWTSGHWRAFSYSPSTQWIGTQWHDKKASVGLRVPSVLIPETYNVILNPEHPDYASAIEIDRPLALKVDGRLAEFIERAGTYPGERVDG